MDPVLLVDDEVGIRLTLSALLEDEGFEVDTVGSCAEARERLASGRSYSVVLLDSHLGDGSGPELVSIIRASTPSARIILVSGGTRDVPDDVDLDARFEKGAPFSSLLASIRSLLGS